MKRSEAIEEINKYMNSDYYASANDLLDFLEKDLGMQPPFDTNVFIEQKDKWGTAQANGYEWREE